MVTSDDLRRVAREYFSVLFDPDKIACGVCCNTSKVEEIKQGLEGYVNVKNVLLTFKSFVFVLKAFIVNCICYLLRHKITE